MVSLCLTKAHIDGTASVAVDHPTGNASRSEQVFQNRETTENRNFKPLNEYLLKKNSNVRLNESSKRPLLESDNINLKASSDTYNLLRQDKLKDNQTKYRLKPVKNRKRVDVSAIQPKNAIVSQDIAFMKRPTVMLAPLNASENFENRKLKGTREQTVQFDQHVPDATIDPYRVHQWRIKTGRLKKIDKSSSIQKAIAKLQQKQEETKHAKRSFGRKAQIATLLQTASTENPTLELQEREYNYYAKAQKQRNACSLDTVLEEKERVFGLSEYNMLNNVNKITSKNLTLLHRLRNHMRVNVSLNNFSHKMQFDEQEIDKGSEYFSPDLLNESNCDIKINNNSKLPQIETPLKLPPKPSSFAPSVAPMKLPPISSQRRKSFPMRNKSKSYVMEQKQDTISSKRFQTTEIDLAIPEGKALDEKLSLRRNTIVGENFSQKKDEKLEKIFSSDRKTTKYSEVVFSGSPTNKKTHSSMTMYSVSTRSGSKEGKDGDTPTDSETSLGASKYRRTRKMRGSKMLSKMESRNSPQAFRYIKASRMDALMNRWCIIAKLAIWLARLCKAHRIVVDDSYNIQTGSEVSGDTVESSNKKEVLFDVTDYKMKNQLRLSDTTRKILCLASEKRTDKDINLVQTALRNIKAIADYSSAVQTQIGKHGYFVGFEGKRVVVREGKKPLNYYLLLAGSAVVIKSDETGNTNPVLFMKRGDVFGEGEILEDINWQWSVATSGYCEFLLLERDAYRKIFITGGGGGLLSDPERGGFLRSISLLKEWPMEILNDNPNRCLFRYFKRGALLVNDNTKSEWIYVIKSGSCSVLKKLMVENLNDEEILQRMKKEQEFHFNVDSKPHLVNKSEEINEEEHLKEIIQKEEEERNRDVSVFQQLEMSSILKELNPDVIGNSLSPRAEAGFEENRSEIPLSSYQAETNGLSFNKDHVTASENQPNVTENMSKYVDDSANGFRLSRHSDRNPPRTPSPTKAAYLRTGINSRSSSRDFAKANVEDFCPEPNVPPEVIITEPNGTEILTRSPMISVQKQAHLNEFLFGASSPADVGDKEDATNIFHPVHINVRRLTKRDSFGLGPELYVNQPSLALVSNGAECLMLHKKFYFDNASEDCINSLKESEYPYPSDNELMEEHWRLTTWKAYQAKIIQDLLHNKKN